MSRFDVADVQRRLAAANGGYEVVHHSSGQLVIFRRPDGEQAPSSPGGTLAQ